MRNPTSNFIPVPVKPSKTAPKSLPRVSTQRKTSSSCQTERVVLVKEENLTFHPCTRVGQNDGGMRRDYVKAINYINSCHKFVNAIIDKNTDNKPAFLLPMVTNYIPIFPFVMGKKLKQKPLEKIPENKSTKSEERKSKSSFAVKKPEEAPIDPLPVGDCGNKAEPREISDIVKEEVQKFLANLQHDMTKAMRKTKSEIPRQKCRNLTIVKQRLEELSKICFLQKNIESNPQIAQKPTPPPPPPMCASEECSVIQSDTDCEVKLGLGNDATRGEGTCSIVSDTSDIESDSELDLIK